MSNPPVQPPQGNDPDNTPRPPQYGQNAPQYGQNAPQYGQQQPPYGQQPQYGQNAPQYGQNAPQYGQQQPAYGQQAPYGQPAAPYGYPSEQSSPGGTGKTPPQVELAFKLILGAGILSALSSLLMAFTGGDDLMAMMQEQARLQGQELPADMSGAMQGVLAVSGVIAALVTFGLYSLVAFPVRKGKNWARILGTVLAAISVFGLFSVFTFGLIYGILQLAVILMGIAGIVLLYLPANAPYFQKQQPFANPYGQPGPYGR